MQVQASPESAPDLAATPVPPRGRWLDLQGWIQAIAGLVIALIALLSSYDHINLPAGTVFQLEQQWGVWFIAASVALVVVDAQLATGSRLRAAQDAARAADEAAESEIEQLRQENRRLAELESRMDALLLSADSCSPIPPATGSS